jgi:hypothetical protein
LGASFGDFIFYFVGGDGMRQNKKMLNELANMLGSAMNFHMTFWMQDDQDLDPGFRRRELQRRKRWKKAIKYFDKLVDEHAKGTGGTA